jgi:hypothetical protein
MRCGGGGALDSELQVDYVGALAGASRPRRPLRARGLDAENVGALAGAFVFASSTGRYNDASDWLIADD